MATITPQAAIGQQIGNCTLTLTSSTALLTNTQTGERIWNLSASMFPPSQVGTPPVVSVTMTSKTHPIHPPPPNGGSGNMNEVGVEVIPLSPPLQPDTTITIETITITLTGARFPGTNIPADCSLVITQSSSSDDPENSFPTINYSQTSGGLSFSGEDTDYSGYETVIASIPAASFDLAQSGSVALNAGVSASINIAPGYMSFYNGAGGAAVATGSTPLLGTIAPTSLTLSANQGLADVFGFPPPAPAYQINLTLAQTGGWLAPIPGSAAGIGTLSAVAANNYDTAVLAVGEDTAGNISYMAALSLELAPSATTQVQYNLALAAGLALVGDLTLAPVEVTLCDCELLINFQMTPPGIQLTGQLGIDNPAPLTTGSLALWPVTGSPVGPFTIDFFPSTVGAPLVQEAWLGLLEAMCSLPDALTRPLTFNSNLGVALVAVPPPATADYTNYVLLGSAAPGVTQAFLEGINLEVTRPADMMVASFSFQNCGVAQLSDGSLQFTQWITDPNDQTVHMTVTLPPQHISECAYLLNDDNSPQGTLGPVPVPTRMAASTSLVLQLPTQPPTPLSAAMLLDWTQYFLLTPQDLLVGSPDPTRVTSLELPYKLMLGLGGHAGWVQPPPPAPEAPASPLWHARLGQQQLLADGSASFVNERSNVGLTARAPWSWDLASAPPTEVFAVEALTPQDREDIVAETEQANADTEIFVGHLILSPLGAWADLRLVSPGSPLSAWTQIISQGRDQYVRAVTVGYLLPWGHVASIIEVAERRFSGDANNTAYLCAKRYIVVGEVTRTYTNADGSQVQLDAVLTQVDLLTQITPTIDQTTGAITVNDGTGPAFIPYVGGQPFLFHARVYDNDQLAQPPRKTADTYLGAIFVDASSSQALITAALNAYNTGSTTAAVAQAAPLSAPDTDSLPSGNGLVPSQVNTLATAALNGQKLALATSNALGDTTHAVTSLSMQVSALVPQGATGVPWNLAAPNFYPALNQAQISLPAVSMLTSGADQVAGDVVASYLPQYLTGAGNPVDAYMSLATPITAALAGVKANGLIAPALAFSGLSRTFGALTGDVGTLANPVTNPLANLLAGNLDPSKFFPSGAKLLNLISFTDLVKAVEGLTSFDNTHIPQIKVDTSDPTKIVATMNWLPTLSWPPATPNNGMTLSGAAPSSQQNTWNVPGGFASLTFNGDLANSLTLNSTITTAPAGPVPVPIPTVSTMVATVNNFTLSVLDLVQINFASLTFTSTTGKKPAVQVSLVQSPLKPFVLTGDIDFLQVLFEAIEDLFGGGPSILVDDEAITLSFEFAVPDLGMGVFDLSNIAIGVDVILSLSTDPIEFHFHYAGPDNPFNLAVDLLGGGGYFMVDAADQAATAISLAVQAGASVSLDLGVASGSISIMMGAFFQSSTAGQIVGGSGPSLGGYVRADGQLSVLDLITIHASFYLGIAYDPGPGIIWGEASIQVEVSVLFFHQSVTLTVRKQFNVKNLLSNAVERDGHLDRPATLDALPPWPIPRDQIMSEADWMTYTQAFA